MDRTAGDKLVYDRIEAVLRVGVFMGLAFVLGGLLAFFLTGARTGPVLPGLAGVMSGLARFDPGALILVGIVIVLSLPVIQALLAAASFWGLGNRRFALVALGVFLVQLTALAVAWLK